MHLWPWAFLLLLFAGSSPAPLSLPGHPVARRFTPFEAARVRFEESRVLIGMSGHTVGVAFRGSSRVAPQSLDVSPVLLFHHISRGHNSSGPLPRKVIYPSLYPGIDAIYEQSGTGTLKSEFRLAPGASVKSLRIEYKGVSGIRIDTPTGDLILSTPAGSLVEAAPVAWQEDERGRRSVDCRYAVRNSLVSFEIRSYDPALPLVIDPSLLFSSLLGGSGVDQATAVATDALGNVYVAGYFDSTDLPGLSAATGVDAFVARYSPDGETLLGVAWYGGSRDDRALAIAVASDGVWIAGVTSSPNLPLAAPLQALPGGARDVFLAKLSLDFGQLLFSSYYGGEGDDTASALALDPSGQVVLAGETASTSLPAVAAHQRLRSGGSDAFVLRLNPSSVITLATYLGGLGNDAAKALAVDTWGNIYLCGITASPNWPLAAPLQPVLRGATDGFVAKLTAQGALAYSTYLGGSSHETATGIAVDNMGSAYVSGNTSSTDFPTYLPFQSSYRGGQDIFLVRLASNGNAFVFSTLLGGAALDVSLALTLDSSGAPWLAGYTWSSDWPVLGAVRPAKSGASDALLAAFTAAGQLTFSTFLGGIEADSFHALAHRDGSIFAAGSSASADVTSSSSFRGGIDSYLVRFLAQPPAYQGWVDAANCSAIHGWAANRSAPATPVRVELYSGSTLITSALADIPRPGLSAIGLTDERHGFYIPTPTSLLDGAQHQISIRAEGTPLPPSPAALTCPPDYAYQGWVDSSSCEAVYGWAWNRNQPSQRLTVDFFDGNSLVGSTTANIFRPGLAEAGIGDGSHSFYWPIPPSLRDSRTHQLRVQYRNSSRNVPNGTASLTCPSFRGYLDSASCAFAEGWVLNVSQPTTPAYVDLYRGPSYLMTVPANLYRPGLAEALGMGTGYNAFLNRLPQTLLDGQSHSITAQVSGGGQLLGTRQTAVCALPQGWDDEATCTRLSGWAWSPSIPEHPLTLDIFSGSTQVASVVANLPRPGLAQLGIGTGNYAYAIPTPAALKDGSSHTVIVKVAGTERLLGGTGKIVQCP